MAPKGIIYIFGIPYITIILTSIFFMRNHLPYYKRLFYETSMRILLIGGGVGFLLIFKFNLIGFIILCAAWYGFIASLGFLTYDNDENNYNFKGYEKNKIFYITIDYGIQATLSFFRNLKYQYHETKNVVDTGVIKDIAFLNILATVRFLHVFFAGVYSVHSSIFILFIVLPPFLSGFLVAVNRVKVGIGVGILLALLSYERFSEILDL